MSSQLRDVANACLMSTLTGLILAQGGNVLAQSAGRVRHADVEEEIVSEPAPLTHLGRPAPLPTTASSEKAIVDKTGNGAKAGAKAATKPAARSTTKAAAKTPIARDGDSIEQTAALKGRLFGNPTLPQQQIPSPQVTQQPMATPAQAPIAQRPSTGATPVERELEELYRKNGRQMPEMDLYEFQPPAAGAAPGNAGMRPGQATAAGPSPGYQPAPRSAKPNFFEKMFGVGRARTNTKAQANVPLTPKGINPPAPAYSPPARPTTAMPQFRPNGGAAAAPGQRMPMQEPAALGPAGTAPARLAQQPSLQNMPGPRGGNPQALMDESGARGDNESLDLTEDSVFQPPRPSAQVAPNPQAKAKVDSPYTGLTITPNETSQSVASGDDFEAPPVKQTPAAKRLAPAAPPAAFAPPVAAAPSLSVPQPAAAAPSIPVAQPVTVAAPPAVVTPPVAAVQAPAIAPPTLTASPTLTAPPVLSATPVLTATPTVAVPSPAAPPAAATPAAVAPTKHLLGSAAGIAAGSVSLSAPKRVAPKADDEESLDLDDEDDDDDDDDLPARPAPAKAAPTFVPTPTPAPRLAPDNDKLIFTRDPSPDVSRNARGPKAAAEPMTPAKPAIPATARGFKGFCPVLLKDERRLVESRAQFRSEYLGRSYSFSSNEAKQTFDENPQKYAPAGGGTDVVRQAAGIADVEGTLEHAAWYRGKLYLFSTAESRREFVDQPSRFHVE